MSTWTPAAQRYYEQLNQHCKPYEIQPTLREQHLVVARLTIHATERLDLEGLLDPFWGLSWVQPHSWLWVPWRDLQSAMIDIICDRETLHRLETKLKTIPEIKHIAFMVSPYVENKAYVMWKKNI